MVKPLPSTSKSLDSISIPKKEKKRKGGERKEAGKKGREKGREQKGERMYILKENK